MILDTLIQVISTALAFTLLGTFVGAVVLYGRYKIQSRRRPANLVAALAENIQESNLDESLAVSGDPSHVPARMRQFTQTSGSESQLLTAP